MSGVTAQQVMRRRFNIIVRHVVADGRYLTEVIYGDKIVAELPDDCLATNTQYQTLKIYRQLPGTLFEYDLQPCYANLPGKSVLTALESWNKDQFEADLLPLLTVRPEMEKHVAAYEEYKVGGDEGVKYLLYDVLVRMYIYAREHNITIQREGLNGLKITKAVDALIGSGYECIEMEPAYEAALRVIHPKHREVEEGGKKYLIDPQPISAFRSACGDSHADMSAADVKQLVTSGNDLQAVKVAVDRGQVENDTREALAGLVARILGQGGVGVTPEEKDLVQYRDEVVAAKLVGRNAMVGLGKIVGEGPLGDRLDACFREVCLRARHLDAEQCYKLAASRVAGMNSAKTVGRENGVLYIRNRLTNTDDVVGARVRPSLLN